MTLPDARLRHGACMGRVLNRNGPERPVFMQHRQAQGRSEAGRAARGPGRGGKPAETGGGTAGVESQLVELQTRVGGLETISERAEDRWEK